MTPEIKWTIVGSIAVALIAGLFAIAARRIPEAKEKPAPERETASILAPTPMQVVGPNFTVSGTTSNIPEGRFLWLGVQIGQLVWPKEPRIRREDKSWSQDVQEFGNPEGGKFNLVLFHVNADGDKRLISWFENGRASGSWPGLSPNDLQGYAQLVVVHDLRLR